MSDGANSFKVALTDNLSLCSSSQTMIKNSSNQSSFRKFRLQRYPEAPLPQLVRKSKCHFPQWLSKNKWHGLEVENSNKSLNFKNWENLQIAKSFCIQSSFKHHERFLIYTKDQW